MEARQAKVSMRGVRKSFLGNEVLHGVDFDVAAGQIHGLVGHNGAGKSTLMKVLAGLYPDYAGEVLLGGQPVQLTSPGEALQLGIAVIYQEFALIPHLDVAANLALGRETRRGQLWIANAKMRSDAKELLERLDFNIPLDVEVAKLSVAHQQLTEIAKALSRQASVLVMDEPTARLAPAERQALFAVARRLADQGTAVVYISHFLEEVLDICDVVTVMRDGEVVASRSAADFTLAELSQEIVGDKFAQIQDPQSVSLAEQVPEIDELATPALELAAFGAKGRPPSNLVLHPGEILGLAGLVGSGRTSLVEAICGARRSKGTLKLAGRQVNFRSAAAAVAAGLVLVPEDRKHRGLVLMRPVGENIALSALRQFSATGFLKAKNCNSAVAKAI
ncbi:MAG: sugar ABC transporter ATP-binding protein, partial [Propionibacteriaceae bacterium]|nr:sugar ABC transporter ATP-binding protein [Propionibacteriaceae bacterium]